MLRVMKIPLLYGIALIANASATADTLDALRRQVAEQERQILRLEVENSRLRYMLTENQARSADPLYGTQVVVKPDERTPSPTTSATLRENTHTVRRGETLSGIAATLGTTPETLAALNQLTDPSRIRHGQRLVLPELETAAPVPPDRPSHHLVQAGENLYRISLRYGVALDALLTANPTVDPHRLRVGQKIRLPEAPPMLAEHR